MVEPFKFAAYIHQDFFYLANPETHDFAQPIGLQFVEVDFWHIAIFETREAAEDFRDNWPGKGHGEPDLRGCEVVCVCGKQDFFAWLQRQKRHVGDYPVLLNPPADSTEWDKWVESHQGNEGADIGGPLGPYPPLSLRIDDLIFNNMTESEYIAFWEQTEGRRAAPDAQ